jgi:hypothetical protein
MFNKEKKTIIYSAKIFHTLRANGMLNSMNKTLIIIPRVSKKKNDSFFLNNLFILFVFVIVVMLFSFCHRIKDRKKEGISSLTTNKQTKIRKKK